MGVYQDAFGAEASEAFTKAIRAWHADVEVVADRRPLPPSLKPMAPTKTQQTSRLSSVLPVPKPLASAVKAGHFGHEENRKSVRPGPDEVRAITEDHAEKLIACLGARNKSGFAEGIAKYAGDFGGHAAEQLERYVRRKAQESSR
jgi:hypothetical protein